MYPTRAPRLGEVITTDERPVPAWDRSNWVNDYVRPARVDHFLWSAYFLSSSSVEGFGFMRAAGDRAFSDEDRAVVHLVRSECGRLFRTTPESIRLPRRAQAALDRLLSGESDKEIARALGISLHTARQYVRMILRAHGVHSRSQLIARWRSSGGSS
jgi:DNA-binding NarL/FixJ family response regulator